MHQELSNCDLQECFVVAHCAGRARCGPGNVGLYSCTSMFVRADFKILDLERRQVGKCRLLFLVSYFFKGLSEGKDLVYS